MLRSVTSDSPLSVGSGNGVVEGALIPYRQRLSYLQNQGDLHNPDIIQEIRELENYVNYHQSYIDHDEEPVMSTLNHRRLEALQMVNELYEEAHHLGVSIPLFDEPALDSSENELIEYTSTVNKWRHWLHDHHQGDTQEFGTASSAPLQTDPHHWEQADAVRTHGYLTDAYSQGYELFTYDNSVRNQANYPVVDYGFFTVDGVYCSPDGTQLVADGGGYDSSGFYVDGGGMVHTGMLERGDDGWYGHDGFYHPSRQLHAYLMSLTVIANENYPYDSSLEYGEVPTAPDAPAVPLPVAAPGGHSFDVWTADLDTLDPNFMSKAKQKKGKKSISPCRDKGCVMCKLRNNPESLSAAEGREYSRIILSLIKVSLKENKKKKKTRKKL